MLIWGPGRVFFYPKKGWKSLCTNSKLCIQFKTFHYLSENCFYSNCFLSKKEPEPIQKWGSGSSQRSLIMAPLHGCYQGWEFAYWFITHWLIYSFCSNQMKDCEPIAQVDQNKWATVSDSLRSLMMNERMSDLLKNCWLKKSKILLFSMFYIGFFYLKNEQFAHSLFFWWAMWAGHSPKMSKVSESLRSLTKNERLWAIRTGR